MKAQGLLSLQELADKLGIKATEVKMLQGRGILPADEILFNFHQVDTMLRRFKAYDAINKRLNWTEYLAEN